MVLFIKIVGIVIISVFSFCSFILLFAPDGIFSAFTLMIFGMLSGVTLLALSEIIKQLRRIADKEPITVESKTIYAEKPPDEKPPVEKKQPEPYWWQKPVESSEPYVGRRCKKCGAPLPDSYPSGICNSCQYGAPQKAKSDQSSD